MNSWLGLVGAAAACSVIELDATYAGQFMVSRPLVLGPVMGAAFGEPGLGAGLGALCELFCLDALPVGGSVPRNAAVAAAAALILALGPQPVAPALAFPAGLLAGWLHARAEVSLRRRRAALNGALERRLAEGREPGFSSVASGQLLRQAMMTFAVLLAVLALRGPLRRSWEWAPGAARSGLSFGLAMSPWPALWTLVRSFKVVS